MTTTIDAGQITTPTMRQDGGISAPVVRRLGLGLSAGAATWGIATVFTGVAGEQGGSLHAFSSLAFQFGLVMLLAVQVRTRATGTGRVARAFLVGEHVLLAGAMLSSLNDALFPNAHGSLYWHIFDACWPLSMLGMLGIGIRIAIAGRWTGAARVWPLVAESWALVVIPVAGAAPAVAGYVSCIHLLLGYGVLGLILARRPELTGAR